MTLPEDPTDSVEMWTETLRDLSPRAFWAEMKTQAIEMSANGPESGRAGIAMVELAYRLMTGKTVEDRADDNESAFTDDPHMADGTPVPPLTPEG